ncbi:MAG TPA: ATP-NAD kinase, partial [Gammaproteobacteria bacterium]|nr:ATP-NAD kinase [Gammaproteobacteria bacterium]
MKIGFLINPMAGIGGPAALKGSDGEAIVREALARGAKPQAGRRAATAMQALSPGDYTIVTAAGDMGEAVLQQLNLPCEVVYLPGRQSSADDTKNAVRLFIEQGADLIVFAGGDGTARDVLDVLST